MPPPSDSELNEIVRAVLDRLQERNREEDGIVNTSRRNEDIANQRLGFMLVFVGLVFVGATNINHVLGRTGLLAWGTVQSTGAPTVLRPPKALTGPPPLAHGPVPDLNLVFTAQVAGWIEPCG